MKTGHPVLFSGGLARPAGAGADETALTTPTEFYRWWVVEEITGERLLTPYKLTRSNAEKAFAGAVPDLATREVRNLAGEDETPVDSRPGAAWSWR
jgi:hypothetical protein